MTATYLSPDALLLPMRKALIMLCLAVAGCSSPERYDEARRILDPEYRTGPVLYQSPAPAEKAEHPSDALQKTTNKRSERPSFSLDDLCDTSISRRELNLHVFIEPSDRLWDYREFRDELFGFLSGFFDRYMISCRVTYHDSPFQESFTGKDSKAIEILDTREAFEQRGTYLSPKEDKGYFAELKGYSASEKGIIIIKGSWEEFRDYLTTAQQREMYEDQYKGMQMKEYILRSNANNIAHEIMHSFGLWHPTVFTPALVPVFDEEGYPNILSYQVPKFDGEHPLGAQMNTLQQQMIHSYLAGRNAYLRFKACENDLGEYARRIAQDNNLTLSSH